MAETRYIWVAADKTAKFISKYSDQYRRHASNREYFGNDGNIRPIFSVKESLPRINSVKNASQRPDVSFFGVVVSVEEQLRSSILFRTHIWSVFSVGKPKLLGETKISNLCHAFLTDKNIFWLEILI